MTTLETGAGHTTVVFAISGTTHVCITPNEAECTHISEYCSDLGLEPQIQFVNQSSDVALPGIAPTLEALDFIFIDGAHRYPLPCVDFHYAESKLKVGGILGLDDVGMPSVKILYDFLCNEDEWELIEKVTDTAFFRRVKETETFLDWQNQNMNKNWRNYTQFKHRLIEIKNRMPGREAS